MVAPVTTGGRPPRVARTDAPALVLVQFVGPIKPEWLERLRGVGVRVVTYMAANAYVVWGDAGALARLDTLGGPLAGHPVDGALPTHVSVGAGPGGAAQAAGAAVAAATVDVTVQYAGDPADETAARLLALDGQVYRPASTLLDLTDLSLQAAGEPTERHRGLAGGVQRGAVRAAPTPGRGAGSDHRRRRSPAVGGNVVPSGPGYLTWLAARGFPTNPANYPIVDVVDDGIDTGDVGNILHPDFHYLRQPDQPQPGGLHRQLHHGRDSATAPTATATSTPASSAAYNNRAGWPYQDANGYRIGLGVSPYGRVAGTKIFRNNDGPYDTSKCGWTDRAW